MGFRFIHTADWQLGKPFGQFPPDLAGELKAARRDVVQTIAATAEKLGIGDVIVAGDVWDSPLPARNTVVQPLEIMGRARSIRWWLMPGNHDPHQPGGLWTRIAKIAPPNVTLLLQPTSVEMRDGVVLLPAPWKSKAPGEDLSEWMDQAETSAGSIRIGLAHGGVKSFEADAIPLDEKRATKARLDYLGLGDWHGTLQVDERTWYSGTPEPDRFVNNDRGQILEVKVDGPGRIPEVIPHRTAKFEWLVVDAEVNAPSDFAELEKKILGERSGTEVLAQLTLSGRLSLSERQMLDEHISAIASRLQYLDVRDTALQTMATPDDLDALGQGGSIRHAAENLKTAAESASAEAEREDALRALSLLFTYAGTATGDRP